MFKKILGSLVCGVFLLGLVVRASGLEMREYRYSQDFEESDPVQFWASNGKYIVNFKGLTEEKSFSGQKSFKLDVTFTEGDYAYWSIPVKMIPAEGNLKFSCRILVEEGTTGTAGLDANVYYPPSSISVSHPFDFLGPTKSEWKLIERDLVGYGKEIFTVLQLSNRLPWGAKKENLGVYIDRIGLFLYGSKDKRVVVYVDDLKIWGRVPTEESYQKEIKKRWVPVEERFNEEIESWQTTLQEEEEQLSSLNDLPPEAEKIEREAAEKISFLKADIEKIKKRGYIDSSEHQNIAFSLAQLKNPINNIKLISEGKIKSKDMLVYVVLSPISSVKILPFDTLIPGEISHEIKMVGTPGEYEPASFVVHSLADIEFLKVEVTDLRGEKGIIPSTRVDIKVVKCWYQAGSAWSDISQNKNKKVLVPELLLNDDSLVKVDHEKEENYLKLNLPEGEKYIWISNSETSSETEEILSVRDFLVKDSAHLLPVNIPAGTNKQFWVTVAIPENSGEGVYTGNINLVARGEILSSLTLKLKVLPFRLASPKRYDLKKDFESSIYYRGRLHLDYPQGTISSEYKSKEQLKSELKDMFIHGVTNPLVYQGIADEKLLGEYLRLREEVGMGAQPLYTVVGEASWPPILIKKQIEFAKSYGIPEVYFYGADEATGERLTSQRPAWEATRRIGGKVFVAGYRGKNFPSMGDIQDLLICAGVPSKEEADKWHSVGHKIWCYANPQGGVENPEVYRRNFGFSLYKCNYDGAATYAYQHSMGNIWNDFDHLWCRDLNFTYPTVDGVIDTIAWEGYREGIDDIRYATTLRLKIEEAKKSGDKKLKETASEAEKYLKTCDVERGNLDTIRLKIINYILTIHPNIKNMNHLNFEEEL